MSNDFYFSTAAVIIFLALGGCSENPPNQVDENRRAALGANSGISASGTSLAAESHDANASSLDQDDNAAAKSNLETSQSDSMYLPVERKFIRNNELRIEAAGEALQSQKFESIARSFEIDTAKDSNALSLTDLYKQSIRKQLGSTGQLVSFSCGLSLCIGALRTNATENYDSWTQKFFADNGTPSYSFADSIVKLAENHYEGRFMFSTDPAANAMTGKAAPRARKQ